MNTFKNVVSLLILFMLILGLIIKADASELDQQLFQTAQPYIKYLVLS